MQELEVIERSFRLPDLNLEEALKLEERAALLAKEIVAYLDAAETKLETVFSE